MRNALTIAGSDSIGGAGIQADVKAMAAVGVHATTVITAITAQNTQGVFGILPVSPEFVQDQLEAVLKDSDIKAVKTGMLYSAEIVETVADILEDRDVPVVVDPVLVSGTGHSLADDDLPKAIRKHLLPICELVTPNKDEAEVLAKMKIRNEDDITLACELIGKEGEAVLLKGGHFNSNTVVDYLYLSSEFNKLEYPRLKRSGHGSGCVLSSYITANMAKGIDIVNSVMKSRALIQEAIATQYAVGQGIEVVNPIVKMKGDTDRFKVLDALDAAAAKIVDTVPEEFVPKGGINIALALKDAAGPEEIAAMDKRIRVHNGSLKCGPAKFGVAEHLSYVLLAAMKKDPSVRSVMSIAFSKDTLSIMEEVGLEAVAANMQMDKVSEGTEEAIAKFKGVPDAIYDKAGKTRMFRIFGKDEKNVLNKLESILRGGYPPQTPYA
ncbi:MAG: bifunctional hydroxymethylpyrimidine kinase/phosphomethylpyrimidine kinase [Candidatus Methanomethylophilaceae archaeon]|nr:bifunctional hydroxymethylpyrimidine kinase/phosphomethylpyrimidine kinase [Candidatus Methanomethylophilaceae archaeon]